MDLSFFCDIGPRSDLSPLTPMRSHRRAIRLYCTWVTGTYQGSPDSHQTYTDILTLANFEFVVVHPLFLYFRNFYKKKLAKILAEIRIPESMIPDLVDRIYEEVEQSDNPEWPIECDMMFRFLYPVVRDVASLLESFEKVGIDSLEDGDRQQLCVVCRERLDHFEGVEEEGIDRVPQLICLPCFHLYHEGCIFQCLEMFDFCPVCRYSLPVVEQSMPIVEQNMEEVIETYEPSLLRLHWPMLLTVTAGGILSAVLVYRLLKQSQG